jgi:hypothetical protein
MWHCCSHRGQSAFRPNTKIDLCKELWKARTTLLFDVNIVSYCYMLLLRSFAIGKLHAS